MSWTLQPRAIAWVRERKPSWEVRETIAKQPATCRECGATIQKGERRLTFTLKGKAEWDSPNIGHIHFEPCGGLDQDEIRYFDALPSETVEESDGDAA